MTRTEYLELRKRLALILIEFRMDQTSIAPHLDVSYPLDRIFKEFGIDPSEHERHAQKKP